MAGKLGHAGLPVKCFSSQEKLASSDITLSWVRQKIKVQDQQIQALDPHRHVREEVEAGIPQKTWFLETHAI